MDASDLQKLFQSRLGIRMGPEMSEYVLRRLRMGEPAAAPVAVMAEDARTGVPMPLFVDPAKVLAGDETPDSSLLH